LVFIFLILFLSTAYPATIYLKNGMTIENVISYRQVDGRYMLYIHDGVVEIPSNDVLKIVEKDVIKTPEPIPEEVKPAPTDGKEIAEKKEHIAELKRRLKELDTRLKEIKKVEDEQTELKKQYDEVRLRIEVLFQKGRKAAQSAGKDISTWFQFLSPQEREWIQINTFKKKELEDKLKEKEEELAPLLEDKEDILKEKRQLSDELERLERL